MKEYLILSQKDKWFSGRFDPQILQQVINDHARQGWEVKSMTNTSRDGVLMGGNKDELIILLEREVPTQGQQIERERKLAEAAKKSFGGGTPPALPPKKPASNGSAEPDIYRLD
jgi:hypothetical protein